MKATLLFSILLISSAASSQEIKRDTSVSVNSVIATCAIVNLQSQYRGCCPPRRFYAGDRMKIDYDNYSKSQRRTFYRNEKTDRQAELGRKLFAMEKRSLKKSYHID